MRKKKIMSARDLSERSGIPLLTEEDMKRRPRGFIIAGPNYGGLLPKKKKGS